MAIRSRLNPGGIADVLTVLGCDVQRTRPASGPRLGSVRPAAPARELRELIARLGQYRAAGIGAVAG